MDRRPRRVHSLSLERAEQAADAYKCELAGPHAERVIYDVRPLSARLTDVELNLVTKDFARTTLRARHRPVVRALAEAMFAPDGDVSSERLDAFVDDVDAFISPASKTLRFGLVLMLVVLRWSPLLFFRLRAFDELSVDDRLSHLERLEKSKITQLPLIVVAYKTVMTMLFYEQEEELAALGYPGPERKRWRRSLPQAAPEKSGIEEQARP